MAAGTEGGSGGHRDSSGGGAGNLRSLEHQSNLSTSGAAVVHVSDADIHGNNIARSGSKDVGATLLVLYY